jgi:TorA maturation chaperone TorD
VIIHQRQVPMKRVFLLSCHPLFGQGVELLLCQEAGLDIVGRQTDVDRAVEDIQKLRPDAVIVASSDPENDFAPVVMRILREGAGTKIVGLDLRDNTVCIYRGEQWIIKEVEDLVKAIEHNPSDPVSTDEWAGLAASRSRVYGFLGAVYNRLPDEGFAESLSGSDLAGFLSSLAGTEDLPESMREGLGLIEGFVRDSEAKPVDELQTELAVERTRLLRGLKPGYGPPPAYESVWLGSDQQPVVQASVAVRQAYAESGVDLPEEVRDQPDFIGLELDFMRHLTEKEAQAWSGGDREGALKALEKERAFLEEHIARWIPRFSEVMVEEARLDFYRGIARMTKGFVLDEAQKVAELLEWAQVAETALGGESNE